MHRLPLVNTRHVPMDVERWSHVAGSLPGTEAKDCDVHTYQPYIGTRGTYVPDLTYIQTYIRHSMYINTLCTR